MAGAGRWLFDRWLYVRAALGALGLCYWLMLFYIVPLAVLLLADQGADAVRATADSDLGFFFLPAALSIAGASGYLIVQAMLSAGTSVAMPGCEQRHIDFAKNFVPFLPVLVGQILWPELVARWVFTGDHGSSGWVFRLMTEGLSGLGPALIYGAYRSSDQAGTLAVTGFVPWAICSFLPLPLALIVVITGLALVALYIPNPMREPKRTLAGAMIVVAVIYAVGGLWLLFDPALASYIGSAATVVVIGLAYAGALGSLWYVAARRWPTWNGRGVGLAFAILIVAIAFGQIQQRAVRTLTARPPTIQPMPYEQYAARWLREHESRIRASGHYPVFIVAAEGGGIRAAYWTASVLSELDDRSHVLGSSQGGSASFADHIVGLSGVSGGSVGVTVFDSLADHALPQTCATERACSQKVLAGDFLAPALATLFTRDILSSLTLGRLKLEDRATSLELAFETQWRSVVGNDQLGAVLSDPRLFLNATNANDFGADSGNRVVLNPASLSAPIRASTAMLLSARFPVISPVAVLGDVRLVDGGYYDNSGAETASELLRALMHQAEVLGLSPQIVPIILSIANNDPPPPQACTKEADASTDGHPIGAAQLPIAHVLSELDLARSAHARRARDSLRKMVPDGQFIPDLSFYACHGERAIPLGWTLSAASREAMDARLDSLGARVEQIVSKLTP